MAVLLLQFLLFLMKCCFCDVLQPISGSLKGLCSMTLAFPGYLLISLFVLRFYDPVNPVGSCWAWSVYLNTLLLGRHSPLTSTVHILLPETDNCPSWIKERERMTVKNISWSNLHKRMLSTRRVLNPQPPDHQSEVHPIGLPRKAISFLFLLVFIFFFFSNYLITPDVSRTMGKQVFWPLQFYNRF